MSLFDSASLIVTPNGYKEDKLYSIKPTDGSGDLVVTRATTATRVNSDGLIEVTPYNLTTYSEQFDNASWGKTNTTITSNTEVAPNGTTTADSFIPNTSSAQHYLSKNYGSGIVPTSSATYSVYAKANGQNWLFLYVASSSPATSAYFNLNTGVVGTNTSGSNATIVSVGNGWYRCSITHNVSGTTVVTETHSSLSGTTLTYSGNGTDGIYLWGAQLVTGTSAKEYFPTTDRLDVPRLDYTNSSCPSILIEPQRTNLLTYSEQFDNAAWTKSNATITANTTISPDGNNNADTYNVVSTTANLIYQNPTLTTGAYSISVYAKKASSNIIRLFNVSSGTSAAWFDLNLGQVIGTVNGGTASIENAGNGWYRCVYKGTSITSGFTGIGLSDTANSATASIGSSVFIWGAQLEAGSNATSYIPTIASSVTRNADVISKTGISSLIGQTEGTLFLDFESGANDSVDYSFSINDGTTTNRIRIYRSTSNTIATQVRVAAVTQALIQTATITPNTRYKCAIAYKLNDVAFYVNGVLIGTDTNATIPTCSVLKNDDGGGTNGFYRPIKSAILWKERLSNTELAQLTTI